MMYISLAIVPGAVTPRSWELSAHRRIIDRVERELVINSKTNARNPVVTPLHAVYQIRGESGASRLCGLPFAPLLIRLQDMKS